MRKVNKNCLNISLLIGLIIFTLIVQISSTTWDCTSLYTDIINFLRGLIFGTISMIGTLNICCYLKNQKEGE